MADNSKLNLERIRACDGEDIWRTICDAGWNPSRFTKSLSSQLF